MRVTLLTKIIPKEDAPRASFHPQLELEGYDDLAQLSAGLEALVGLRGPIERELGGDWHGEVAGREAREHGPLDEPRRLRLVLERARAQRRAVNPRALGHQQTELDLGLAAGADPDHADAPA